MSDISAVRNSILDYELKKKTNNPSEQQINARDVQGRGKIDANSDGKVSSRELESAARRAGVNLNALSRDDKQQLIRELSTFVKQGGSFAQSSTDVKVFSFVVTPSVKNVKSGALNDDGVPDTFHRGQTGGEIRKVNVLLRNLGFPASGDKFDENTEKFVKDFQLRNFFTKDAVTGEMKPKKGYENITLGVIDAKTLEIMEEATKSETPYILEAPSQRPTPTPQTNNPGQITYENKPVVQPLPTNTNPTEVKPPVDNSGQTNSTNTTGGVTGVNTDAPLSPGEVGQFERVRREVKNQIMSGLVAKGMSPEDAEKKADESFSLGSKLTTSAIRQDKAMGTDNMCYTAVKRDLEQTLKIPYKRYTNNRRGDFARTASNTLFKENSNLFQKVQVPRSDVKFLPPGAVVVYHPSNKAEAGHIGVQTIQLKTPAQAKSGAQGLPATNVYEQDGKIVGLDVKVGNKTVKYTVQDGKVIDPTGKPTNLTFNHADISDKQRNDPWSGAPVDVFYPVGTR